MSRWRKLVADTRPLQVPAFRRLWFADIVTEIGGQFTVVAVPAQLYFNTHNSAYVGLAGLFGLVPLIIFGLYGGALADVMDRRLLAMISSSGLIASSFLFFVQAALGNKNPWLLLCLFSVQQIFFAVNQPTRSAILPRIIHDRSMLPAANSLHMTVVQAGAIVGPLLAGVLLPLTGFPWLYAIDTLGLFVTLYAIVRLPSMPIELAEGEERSVPGIRSIIEGFAYLKGHTVLLMSFVVDLIAMIFGMPRAIFPEFAHLNFHGPDDGGIQLSLLYMAIPAGAVLGGVLGGWISHVHRLGRVVTIAIAIWGLGVLAFGAAAALGEHGHSTTFLVIGFVSLAVAGAADMASASIRSAMLQSAADDNVRGRLQGVFTVVVAGGPRIADVLHGTGAATVGAAATTMGGGVLVVIGMVVCAFAAPIFWNFTRSQRPTQPVT